MKFCPACGTEYPNSAKVCKHDRTALRPKTSDKDPLLGKVLKDTYRIDERIAGGGMSTIYRATQLVIERPVAIKVLLPNLQPDETFVKRFFREAKLLGQLNHPNVVALYDCGRTDEGLIYLVTEHLKGHNLNQMVPADRGMPFADILTIMSDICAAVSEAHAKNIIHRDLKPSNVFILDTHGNRPQVKVLDFGIAKSLEKHSQELTQAGSIVGTPGYMAPEQVKLAHKADHRADVYALGALLYLMAAGRPAFAEGSGYERLKLQLTQDPPLVDFAGLGKPPGLNDVIQKAMHRDPEARYQSADELATALVRNLHQLDRGGAPATTDEDDEDATVLEMEYHRELLKRGPGAVISPLAKVEKSLRREKWLSRLLMLALLAALAGAGFLAYQQYGARLLGPAKTTIHEVLEGSE